MLQTLSIRDVVLVERLDLTFRDGLCVLTGETGAGKSILLDALGLALGARGDALLVRHGADRCVVTAAFQLPPDHLVTALLEEQGLEVEEPLVLRRILGADGRSRGFANDQPVSMGLLRQIGETLVEIQGQHDQRGLLDQGTHRGLLDAYGRLGGDVTAVRDAWRSWREARDEAERTRGELERAREDEDLLRHAVEELAALAPEEGEEEILADRRTAMMSHERLAEALSQATAELSAGRGVDGALRSAQRSLERVADKAGGAFDEVLAALERAAVEAEEALNQLEAAGGRIESEPGALEEVEERLFALRAVARKHDTEVGSLPALLVTLQERMGSIEGGADTLARLDQAEREARERYAAAAKTLSERRAAAAAALDKGVSRELPPLKLEKATFRTRIEPLDERAWGPEGSDRVSFEIRTNPGAPYGPLGRIASGGELARFMLALRVVLAESGSVSTLVFDEVDAGIGGAVAAAVGERLESLARSVQVLVVTHSPQVAARGAQHWQVAKGGNGREDETVATRVEELGEDARREEIARMLSGAKITDEARAAARSLMSAGRG